MSRILRKLENREKIERDALESMSRILTNGKIREKIPRGQRLERRADAILTAAGNKRLTKKWVPGERDLVLKVRDRRLARYRKKTAESIMEWAELREKIAVGLELCRQAESKLIKKEQT